MFCGGGRRSSAFETKHASLAWGLALVVSGCAAPSVDSATGARDASVEAPRCPPSEDKDRDRIWNWIEGCETGRDTDGDRIPDWLDYDADGDGRPDRVEAGEQTRAGHCAHVKPPRDDWPCDTDGDGKPDYLDVDSDDDGLRDGDEDLDGDGRLGCCMSTCGGPIARSCSLPEVASRRAQCGFGQRCVAGVCTPRRAYACAAGETDPLRKDTFGDGFDDKERGTSVCSRAGREDVDTLRWSGGERYTGLGALHVAIPRGASIGRGESVPGRPLERIVRIDDPRHEVAAFVVVRPTTAPALTTGLATLTIEKTRRTIRDLRSAKVTANGWHERRSPTYPYAREQVRGVSIAIEVGKAMTPAALRDHAIAGVLDWTAPRPSPLPAYGNVYRRFVLRLLVERRFAARRGSAPFPVDVGGVYARRLVVVGAVAPASRTAEASPRLDDFSAGNAVFHECSVLVHRCALGRVQRGAIRGVFVTEREPVAPALALGLRSGAAPRPTFAYDAKTRALTLPASARVGDPFAVAFAVWSPMYDCFGL